MATSPQWQFYILEGKKPVPVDGVAEWEEWCQDEGNGVVAEDELARAGTFIRTAFLRLPRNLSEEKVFFFETFVSGGRLEAEMRRYVTWQEAEEGHRQMVLEAHAAASPA